MFEVHPLTAYLMGKSVADEFKRARQVRQATEAEQWQEYAEQLQDRLVITEAKLAGALALVAAFKQNHPNSPLFANTDKVFKSGDRAGQQKSVANTIWEQAFDTTAKQLGVENPTAHRED